MAAPSSPADPPSPPLETWSGELRLLLGPDAGGLLAAVAATAGGEMTHWRARQVDHKPDRFTVVQYRVHLAWPDGRETSETFVAATGQRIPAEGAALFDDGQTRVAVWRWQHDPFLAGLSAALNPTRVASLLDEVGVDGGSVQLRTRAYRPARRAVVEATGRRGRLFLKVVRPDQAAGLHELHRLLSGRVPIPESLGWSDAGVVVLSARPGQTLRQALRSSAEPMPPPQSITDLLDRLPEALTKGPRRRDLVSSASYHAEVIRSTVPAARPLLDPLLEALGSNSTDQEVVPVHGDLYEAQILVDRGRVTGLLDVDTAGPGFRIDDLANFCAHLSVLAQMSDRPRQMKRYGAELLAHSERHHSSKELRARIAAAVIGLATGPFRVLEANWEHNTVRRLELARDWLDGVDAGD